MRLKNFTKVSIAFAVVLSSMGAGYVLAYSTQVVGNLQRTRDALLDQRTHLRSTADRIKLKINDLQKQLDVVNGYLADTERSLKDVEDALDRIR